MLWVYASMRCTTFVHNTNCASTANGILRAIKRVLGKLTGKNKGISEGLKLFSEDIAAGRKAVDEITKALSEVAKQPRSVPTTEQTEANQIGAKENAAENGDAKSSKKIMPRLRAILRCLGAQKLLRVKAGHLSLRAPLQTILVTTSVYHSVQILSRERSLLFLKSLLLLITVAQRLMERRKSTRAVLWVASQIRNGQHRNV